MSGDKRSVKLIAQNKKAFFDYFIQDTYQAGIELTGTEVKSMRLGRCNLKDSYVRCEHGEAYIYNMHIAHYKEGNIFNADPLRKRRLLLHKYEIRKLIGAITREGMTIVPIKVYFLGSLVKLDIAVAKGKKQYDKRADIAKKDMRREMQKDFKVRNM